MKFEEILVAVTLLTGAIWLLDAKVLRAKRHAVVGAQTSVKEPWWVEYSRSFFPILLLVLVLRSFVAEPFRIPSGSMKPTLLEGDFIVVNKFQYGLKLPILGTTLVPIGHPKRGDIIVFHHFDRKDLIKRIVGMPGDRIAFKDDVLYINGQAMETTYLSRDEDDDLLGGRWLVERYQEQLMDKPHDIYIRKTGLIRRDYQFNDVVVPSGKYFVMGDNRHNSDDSRFWGFVEEKNIIGRAFATWMSWDSRHNVVRWERVFKKIDESK